MLNKKYNFLSLITGLVVILTLNHCEKKEIPPTCIVIAPAEGQKIRAGRTITIWVDAEDSDGSITEIGIYIDDVEMGSSANGPIKYVWETTDGSIGSHSITVKCSDNDGNVSSNEKSISVSNIGMPGQPCPDMPTITYEGQVYNTEQIGSQCWMAENLNVGKMVIGSTADQRDNGNIEKFCYNNEINNCYIYGGFYQWDEMMAYDSTPGTQGICPTGWHIPTDDEWKILEGTVDSQYGVGNSEWELIYWRGFDAGGNLKESGTSHWIDPNNGASNSSGFTALPAGVRRTWGEFEEVGASATFWSSVSPITGRISRTVGYMKKGVYRSYGYGNDAGLSIRCIRD